MWGLHLLRLAGGFFGNVESTYVGSIFIHEKNSVVTNGTQVVIRLLRR